MSWTQTLRRHVKKARCGEDVVQCLGRRHYDDTYRKLVVERTSYSVLDADIKTTRKESSLWRGRRTVSWTQTLRRHVKKARCREDVVPCLGRRH